MVTRILRYAVAPAACAVLLGLACSDSSDSATGPVPQTGGVAPKFQIVSAGGTLDIGPYIDSIRFRLSNGQGYDTTATVAYSVRSATFAGIPPSDVVVVIEALDRSGQVVCRGSDTVTVIAGQTVEPTIQLRIIVTFIVDFTSPGPADTLGVDTVTLRGVVRSANPLAYVRIGQTIVPTDAQGAWQLAVKLVEGPNTFVMTARDLLNNSVSDTIVVWYRDRTGPAIRITPASGTVSSIDSVLVQVTAADPSGVAGVTIQGAPAVSGAGVWSSWVRLTGPSNTIRVTAVDSAPAGNITTDSVTVFYNTGAVDTTRPLLAIISPSADTVVYDTAAISVRGTASDPGSGIARVVVNTVEASYDAQTGQWAVVIAPRPGTLMVRALAEDNAGNIAWDSVAVICDTTPRQPQWRRDRLEVALNEGQAFTFNLADSCSQAGPSLSFALLPGVPHSQLVGGTYVFTAGVRSAGTYTDILVAWAVSGRDTLRDSMTVAVTVAPVSYRLTTASADTLGTVDPLVSAALHRWGDTVTVNAIARSGCEFDYWSGDVEGGNARNAVLAVVMTRDKSVTAHFKPRSACRTVTTAEDLNAVIHEAYSGAMPAYLCPEQGDYLNGTAKVRIVGAIRIVIN